MNFFQRFFEFFKVLNLKRRVKKLNNIKEKTKDIHPFFEDGVDYEFDFNSPKSELELEIEKVLEDCNWNQKLILEYIKSNGTPVHIFKLAGKILDKIGEHEGFITPVLGFRALFLNLIVNHKISFETESMFVMSRVPDDIYIIIYEFYKWYSYKRGLLGYDIRTQNLFKKVWLLEDEENLEKLGLKQMMNLKEAIKRDFEAINFVKRIASERGDD